MPIQGLVGYGGGATAFTTGASSTTKSYSVFFDGDNGECSLDQCGFYEGDEYYNHHLENINVCEFCGSIYDFIDSDCLGECG